MLTRSPIPPASANASPSCRSFHYAPAHSPRQSPSRAATAAASSSLSRRQSMTSSPAASASLLISSPLQPRPKRYVAVDAATQYSPMEPYNYLARTPPAAASASASASASAPSAERSTPITPLEPPPTPPGPTPMEPGIEQGVVPAEPSQVHPPLAVAGTTEPQPNQTTVAGPSAALVSPTKRRGSQGPGSGGEGPSAVQGPSMLAKRPKAESRPPKVLPLKYELCPVEDMVVLIANMLGELIETNDALALKSGHLTRFHSRTAPGISVLDYLHRLAKHATLTQPLLLSMVYYIDRLCALYTDFTINTLTVHRFLITAATVAAKGLSDSFWNNSTYARVGGVRVAELKLLELEFLYRVDWKIVPNPEVLIAYYRGLVERSAGYVLQGGSGSKKQGVDDEVMGDDAIIDDEDEDDDDDSDEEESSEDAEDDEVTSEAGKEPIGAR